MYVLWDWLSDKPIMHNSKVIFKSREEAKDNLTDYMLDGYPTRSHINFVTVWCSAVPLNFTYENGKTLEEKLLEYYCS